MPSEWLVPATAAAVGIAGSFFTWLSGRTGVDTQILLSEGQREHDLLVRGMEQRQEVFAAFLTQLELLDVALLRGSVLVGDAMVTRPSDPIAPEILEAIAQLQRLWGSAQSVRLIGSQAVRTETERVLKEAADAMGKAAQEGTWKFVSGERQEALLDAMRADLRTVQAGKTETRRRKLVRFPRNR